MISGDVMLALESLVYIALPKLYGMLSYGQAVKYNVLASEASSTLLYYSSATYNIR